MRTSCGETTNKVACEISTFHNFVENSNFIIVSKYGSARDFKKFPFNQSCKLIAYLNTTKNKLLAKFLKVL